MSNRFQLINLQRLLTRAAAKSNDSSEEKHITEYLNDILADDCYSNEDKINIIISASQQMMDFCELVIKAAEEDKDRGAAGDGDG